MNTITSKSELHTSRISSALVPGTVDICVLTPPGFTKDSKLPLLLHLHGGGLDHRMLERLQPFYEKLWAEDVLPPMVVGCFNGRGSWYLNYIDGSELWEDFIFEFQEYILNHFHTSSGPENNYIMGLSMGGMGALRTAFKHPGRFGAVVSTGAAINPVYEYHDLQPRNYVNQHNLPPDEQAKRWGWPVDNDYYEANNVPTIARDHADTIRESGLKIYIEAGDRDFFNSHDGAEFLHHTLWENRIEHEYRLLHDCDHMGSSLRWRYQDMHTWLGRISKKLRNPEAFRPPEPNKDHVEYMSWLATGCTGKAPEVTYMDEFDDAWVSLLRNGNYLPETVGDNMDKPLGGVFRNK